MILSSIRLKPISRSCDIARLADEVIEKSKAIPVSKRTLVEQLLLSLQKRQFSETGNEKAFELYVDYIKH